MYKISNELNEAINSIFPNTDEGFIALGTASTDIGMQREQPLSNRIDPLERVSILRRKIEDWVELYGFEMEEFDSDYDSLRISSEAKGLLLALREIQRCFPESVTTRKG